MGGGSTRVPTVPGAGSGSRNTPCFVGMCGGKDEGFKVTASSVSPSPHSPPPTPQLRLRCFLGAQGPFLWTPRACIELGGCTASGCTGYSHNTSGLNKTS